jgi:hypothetical protein
VISGDFWYVSSRLYNFFVVGFWEQIQQIYALKRLQNLRELSVAARGSKRTRLVPDGFRGVAALIAAWAQGAVLWKSW